MINMNNRISLKIINFLSNDICLNKSSILLGIKLAKRNNISLPISLWSYGLITSRELDRLYYFLFNTNL